jgi:hypothetical protein
MMVRAYSVWITLVAVLALCGCGGGGGGSSRGSSGGSAQEEAAARDRAFADEAVQRVLDRSRISCTAVVCEGDGEMTELEDGNLGTIIASCKYDCLPVAIDLEEERHYQVRLLWRRIPATCFDRDDYEIFILAQVPVPCIPTQ